METKALAFGIAGFLLGGLVVSVAATQLPTTKDDPSHMNMGQMSAHLEGKSGDDYDAAFLRGMIVHHEGALRMAELSAQRAEHDEVKQLSEDIIAAQEAEISQMKEWQREWDYGTNHYTH